MYKRQAWITGLRASQAATRDGLPMRSVDVANGGLEKFNPLADWSEREVWAYLNQNPVSYTHLDVYKRQARDSFMKGASNVSLRQH